MKGSVRDSTLHMQLTTMAMLANDVGWDRDLRRMTSKDIEAYRSKRLDAALQAPEGCPYVFMDRDRWEYYRLRSAGWTMDAEASAAEQRPA